MPGATQLRKYPAFLLQYHQCLPIPSVLQHHQSCNTISVFQYNPWYTDGGYSTEKPYNQFWCTTISAAIPLLTVSSNRIRDISTRVIQLRNCSIVFQYHQWCNTISDFQHNPWYTDGGYSTEKVTNNCRNTISVFQYNPCISDGGYSAEKLPDIVAIPSVSCNTILDIPKGG